MESLPLHGVRILDLSWIIAGPTATRHMAIMGAEVIKVGSSKRPDPSYSGPAFHSYNQSKQYVSVNLASAEGIEIVKDLVIWQQLWWLLCVSNWPADQRHDGPAGGKSVRFSDSTIFLTP